MNCEATVKSRVWTVFAASICILCGVSAIAQANVYVANLTSNDVSIIDRTNTVVATVPVGLNPDGIAATADGKWVYVTNFESDTVTAINTATNEVTATVSVGSGPVGLAITPDGESAYVANRGDQTLSVIQLATNTVTAIIPVGSGPDAVAITPDGSSAYVTNSFSQSPGLVSVVDTHTNTVSASVVVARNPNRVAITPDGRMVYVTNFRSWNVAGIDPTTNAVVTTIRVFGRPSGIAVNPNGTRAYVVTLAGQVQVIDTATNRIVDQSIGAGSQPYGLAVTRNGGWAYVANFASDSVSVLDLIGGTAVGTVTVGAQPFAVAIACGGGECTEAPYTPRPTPSRTLVPTATPTSVPPPTMTALPTATLLPTAPPVTPIVVVAGTATGRPGNQVEFTVSLNTSGQQVAGVQNDLTFPAQAPVPSSSDQPACAVNPSIHKYGAFGFLPPGCQPGLDCEGLRALIFSLYDLRPIADGSVLYTCTVNIAPTAAPGVYPLAMSNLVGGDPTGAQLEAKGVDGAINVLSAGAQRISLLVQASGSRVCSAGSRDGTPCTADSDCPNGACAVTQGVCDGGNDDGLLCDCAGGTCTAGLTCGSDAALGTCRGGPDDGLCCDPQSNCANHSPCTGTQRVCIDGPARGLSCLRDAQCPQSQCGATGKTCGGGDFDGFSCVADGDCPRGACVRPAGVLAPTVPPGNTPTAEPDPGSAASSGGGCAIAASVAGHGSGAWCGALLLLAWKRRHGRTADGRQPK